MLASHVLEHVHYGLRHLLCQMVDWLKPGGLLVIYVPNAANLRKRIGLLFGSTNYPDYREYFLDLHGRGHVREYVLGDLQSLAGLMRLELVELTGVNMLLQWSNQPKPIKWLYRVATFAAPASGLRDSLLLVARKPQKWSSERVAVVGSACGIREWNSSDRSNGVPAGCEKAHA